MKIAIDISPLQHGNYLQHAVRGTGFYTQHLLSALKTYYPENQYALVLQGEKVDQSVDLIHYPYFEPFFLTLPIRKSKKTVVTIHDLTPLVFPKHFPSGVKGLLKWQIQRYAAKSADYIITDSNCSKKDIMQYMRLPEKKVGVVYLAASESFKKIHSASKSYIEIIKKYGLPDKFALYVGDVTWNKNLPRLIQAIQQTSIPLVLVGKALRKKVNRDNPWNKDIVTVQKIFAKKTSVRALGFVDTEELVLLYNIASLMIMPSLYEGFGLPVLEAMQCGCPVITTKNGSLSEIAGEAAYFVDPESVVSIKEGIEKVFYSGSLQKELAERGIKQAEKFTWKKTAAMTIDIYKQII